RGFPYAWLSPAPRARSISSFSRSFFLTKQKDVRRETEGGWGAAPHGSGNGPGAQEAKHARRGRKGVEGGGEGSGKGKTQGCY
ncbi:MAG: hypothetical protein ACK55Z_09335, partial [bacterium]